MRSTLHTLLLVGAVSAFTPLRPPWLARGGAVLATPMTELRDLAASPTPSAAAATCGWHNFYLRSVANWTSCDRPDRKPDLRSGSGSSYWDMGDHVVRYSDHWSGQFMVGSIKECRWYLNVERPIPNLNVAARCDYADFLMLEKKSMKKRQKWSKRKRRR